MSASSSAATALLSSRSEYSSVVNWVMATAPPVAADGTPFAAAGSPSSTCGAPRRGGEPGGTMSAPCDLALLGVDVAEVLHHLERAALGPGDVHVQAHVVLSGHHLGRTSRALCDAGVIQRRD